MQRDRLSLENAAKEDAVAELKMMDFREVDPRKVTTEGAVNVNIRWLISEKDGATRFQMRIFEVGPSGRTPLHRHDWEHEVFIVKGAGKLIFEGKEKPFSAGYFLFVPEGKEHSFVNTGKDTLEFLCMIPAGTGAK
jgi:quercetin dioxygenase-like cupin family protein